MSAYAFGDIALILGSLVVAVMSTTVAVTLLLRRRQAAPPKAWLTPMLRGMAQADACRLPDDRHRLNPARLPMQRM